GRPAPDLRPLRAPAAGPVIHRHQHRLHRRRGAADAAGQRCDGGRRGGPLAAAVLVGVPRGDQELRRDRVRPRCPHGQRLLALGRRQRPGVGHRAGDRRRRQGPAGSAGRRGAAAQRRRLRRVRRRRSPGRPRAAPLLRGRARGGHRHPRRHGRHDARRPGFQPLLPHAGARHPGRDVRADL
ncbi:MAG: Phospholipid-binding protein, partial [uncultured Blastococcus sp.]